MFASLVSLSRVLNPPKSSQVLPSPMAQPLNHIGHLILIIGQKWTKRHQVKLPRISLPVPVRSSFPVLHFGIFVQIVMRINWKWIPVESISMQIYICHNA